MNNFILHDYRTGDEINVTFIDFRSEGSEGQPCTHIWWRDENLNYHSATVKETPEEIRIITGHPDAASPIQ